MNQNLFNYLSNRVKIKIYTKIFQILALLTRITATIARLIIGEQHRYIDTAALLLFAHAAAAATARAATAARVLLIQTGFSMVQTHKPATAVIDYEVTLLFRLLSRGCYAAAAATTATRRRCGGIGGAAACCHRCGSGFGGIQ